MMVANKSVQSRAGKSNRDDTTSKYIRLTCWEADWGTYTEVP